MAQTYIYGDNYINDYVVLTLSEFNYKITDEYRIVLFDKLSKIITDVYNANNKPNANILKYLKFDIVDINNEVNIIPDNFICALWLNIIFPLDFEFISDFGLFPHKGDMLSFDEKSKKLVKNIGEMVLTKK